MISGFQGREEEDRRGDKRSIRSWLHTVVPMQYIVFPHGIIILMWSSRSVISKSGWPMLRGSHLYSLPRKKKLKGVCGCCVVVETMKGSRLDGRIT